MNRSGSLRFSMIGFPIEIHWSFFLIAALLGFSNELDVLATWVGVVLVSVLVHEMGHAIVGRRLGMHPEILLYGMGGLTSWRTGRRLTRGQSILVSVAGPAAGLSLAAIVFGVRLIDMPDLNPLGSATLYFLWRVNLLWSIFNLVPILPLDGGNIMRSLVHVARGGADERLPRQISIAFAAAGLVAAFMVGQQFLALFAGYLIFVNYQALQGIPVSIFPGLRR